MSQRPAIRKRPTAHDLAGLPPWLVRGERLLIEAVRSVRLLGSVVPRNAAQERARLVEAFEWTVAALDEVVEFKRLFGRPDYFLRVAVADLAAYEEFLTQRIMPIPGLGTASSHFAMKNIVPPAR